MKLAQRVRPSRSGSNFDRRLSCATQPCDLWSDMPLCLYTAEMTTCSCRGQGFVLDNFPRTKDQAEQLERALTSLDLTSEAAYAARASRVAPPAAGAFADPNRPLTSCLDTVIILELDDEETAIHRAIGRRMDPETQKLYHLELAPPPHDVPGLLERLVPVSSGSNDSEQIQFRMTQHQQTGPALYAWLRRFEKLAHSVDGAATVPELTERVLAIAKTLADCKAAAAQCVKAAEAANAARTGAEAAAVSAEQARGAAAAVARELLLAKKAELEAKQLLQGPPEPVKGAKKAAKGAPADDPAAKEAAAAATKLLAAEAAARCAEHLAAGNAASMDAQKQADAAKEQAGHAQAAHERAERSKHDAERSLEAQRAACSAAEAAGAAAAGALQAAERAAHAAQLAAAVVAEAQWRVETAQAEPGPETQKALDALPDQTTSDSAVESSATKPAESKEAISDEAVAYLHAAWTQAEGSYIARSKAAFASVRRLREAATAHTGDSTTRMLEYLRRGDAKQLELTKFVAQYNKMDVDTLHVHDVQAELALQADELRDRLWTLCDSKHAENEKLLTALVKEPFAADATAALAAQFVSLLQSEVDRYAAALTFVRDYAAVSAGLVPPDSAVKAFEVTASVPPPELAPLLDAKKGATFPEWIAASGAPAQLQAAAKLAVAAIMHFESGIAFTDDAAAPEKKGAAAKGKGKDKNVPEQSPEDAAALEAAKAAAQPMLEQERTLMLARVRAMLQRAAAHAQDVNAAVKACGERMAAAVKRSYTQECEVVASAVQVIKDAVLAAEKIPHDLRLEQEAVIIDECTDLVQPHVAQQACPAQPQSRGAGLLDVWHLERIVDGVTGLCASEFIPMRTLAELLHKLSAATGADAFPEQWRAATYKQMRDALALFDAHCSGYVDWLHVVSCLLLQSTPWIATSPPARFAEAAQALAAASSGSTISEQQWLDCTLWFEAPHKRPGCGADLEAAQVAALPPQAECLDVEAAVRLKRLLWRMFSKVRCTSHGRC